MKMCFLVSLFCASIAAADLPTVTLDLNNRPVVEAIVAMANQARLHLIADAGIEDELGQRISLQVAARPWDEVALRLREHGIAVHVEDTRLRVRSAVAEERARYRLKIYDVRALMRGTTMYPGPDLDIPEPGGSGSMLLPPVADDASPELDEFVDLIQSQIHPESWGKGVASIDEFNGNMVITQTPEILAEIDALLQAHERFIGRQIICEIFEIATPTDPRPVVQADIAKGLLAQGKSIATFVCENGAQNHHFSGHHEQILADVDRVQGTYAPIVSVVAEGLVIDVQPSATVGGILAMIRFAKINDSRRAQSVVRDNAKGAIAKIDTVDQDQIYHQDQRLIPVGGAALYIIGDRCYALTCTVH